MNYAGLPQIWGRSADNSWYVTLDGKQIRLGSTMGEAKKMYRRVLAEQLGVVMEEGITLTSLTNKFMLDSGFGSDKTKQNYRRTAQQIYDYFSPTLAAAKVMPHHIHRWLDHQGIGVEATRKRIGEVLRMFNWGVEQGYLKVNHLKGIKKPKSTPRQDFIEPDDLLLFVSAIQNSRAGLVARFMLETGCRVREVRCLVPTMYVPKGKRFILSLADSKGKKRKRTIFLSDQAVTIVEHLLGQRTTNNPAHPIFSNTNDDLWQPQALGKHFAKAGKKIGLKFKVCGTVLRHSFTYYRLLCGQDVATVSKLLGHNSTEMVMKVYGHMEHGPLLEQAANAVELPELPNA